MEICNVNTNSPFFFHLMNFFVKKKKIVKMKGVLYCYAIM